MRINILNLIIHHIPIIIYTLISIYPEPHKCNIFKNSSELRERVLNIRTPWEEIAERLTKGEMGGYLSISETNTLMHQMEEAFPELIRGFEVGKTVGNRVIYGVILSYINTRSTSYIYNSSDSPIYCSCNVELPGVLVTGGIHAREIISLTMPIYIVLRLIYDYYHSPASFVRVLLHQVYVYIVPVINVDSAYAIMDAYKKRGILTLYRKNRNERSVKGVNCTYKYNYGVDLNRNWGYKFAYDNIGTYYIYIYIYIGSSANPCDDAYRGSGPFSEPETQAIANFINSHPNVKASINYHTSGNLYIIPFNYINDPDNSALREHYLGAFYEEYFKIVNFTENVK